MKVAKAIENYIVYHRANSKKNTIRNHEYVLQRFREQFAERELETITAYETPAFLAQLTEGKKQTAKRVRYTTQSLFQLHQKHHRSQSSKPL